MAASDRTPLTAADGLADAGRARSHPGYEGLIGIARRDITPQVGIHNRMWAAAKHSTAAGIHRPLLATAMVIRGDAENQTLLLVSLDLGWWRSADDERALRQPILARFGIDDSRLMLHLTHTHAGPCICQASADKPGGEMIRPYLDFLRQRVIEAILEASESVRPARMEWAIGRCDLACNRLLAAPDGSGMLVGFNPDTPADDTLLVGRVVDEADQMIATIINYACHPTSLGPGNQLISPDYVGAARELIEQATRSAPCLFLNGAGADLGPRDGFSDDTEVADRNGRRLGHAATGVLEAMIRPRHELSFSRIVVSGARLGIWEPAHRMIDSPLTSTTLHVKLPLRQLAPASELMERLKACVDPVETERLERAQALCGTIDTADDLVIRVWLWRVGGIVFLGMPAEAHSQLQTQLRERFPTLAIVVMNIVNGYLSYLPRHEEYRDGSYQAEVALYEAGALERLIDACAEAIGAWSAWTSHAGAEQHAASGAPATRALVSHDRPAPGFDRGDQA